MSPRSVIRALGTLAVVIVLWGAVVLFRGSLSDTAARLELPALVPADVDRVEIDRGGDTVRLARDEAGWTVNGHVADAAQVGQLFRALSDSALSSELIARSATSHGRLGVDTGGRRVRFLSGPDALLDLVVGTSGRGFQTFYARRTEADEVFLMRGGLGGLVSRAVEAWRDRSIARIDGGTVEAIAIVRGGVRTDVVRDGGAWLVGGVPADSAVVGRLLRGLADVAAIAFADERQRDSLDFTRPERRLTVLGPAADTLLALTVDSSAAGYWVQVEGRPDVYQLDFWRVNELTPSAAELRGER